jgi:aminodeoxychorismate synthase component I
MEIHDARRRNLAKESKMGGDGKWCRMAPAFMSSTGNPTTTPPSCSGSGSGSAPRPLVAAQCLRERNGFVWLDSSLEDSSEGGTQGISLLATDPDLLLEGGPADWHLLERELETRRRVSPNEGIPDGAAIGFFRFDGSFRFGFYDHPHIHTPEGWLGGTPVPMGGRAEAGLEPGMDPPAAPASFQPEMERADYVAMVRAAQEYVASGDIYQVCLAHRFSTCFEGDPWPLYLALRSASPAPHAAYLELGGETVLSSSPECFLRMSGRAISTRPIKGTRPRGKNPDEDTREAFELQTSPKEIAELVMITDLERNDLGSVCEYGSVTASQLLQLERFAQVFHLVSTVEGRLRKDVSQVAALAACFPGGSISGAPKKRALEIIRELEPVPRGLFTGAIGYFGYNGESQFNIAIRTVVIRDGRAEFHVGAGITADSSPGKEWEETLHKAAGILQAARGQ